MKILKRYALQEHVGPLVFALAALTSLLLLNYIAKNIGQLVGKGLPWSVIAEFVGLSVPFTVAMTMPMAVLVAVLYAFSRLAAENEITALKASGVGLSRLLTPVLIGASVIALAMIGFNDQILPRSNHRLRTLMEDIARKKPTFALHARVINEVSPGKLYLQAGHLDDASDRMREVVIYDLGDPTRRRTIYADSGTMALTPSGDLALVLYDGSMQEVQKANPGELQRLYYVVNHIRVRGVGNSLSRSTNDTYKSEREMSICEMQQVAAESERSDAGTRNEIEHTLVNGVRVAATGTSLPSPPPPGTPGGAPFRAHWSLGRAYCDMVGSLTQFAAAHGYATSSSSSPPAPPSAGGGGGMGGAFSHVPAPVPGGSPPASAGAAASATPPSSNGGPPGSTPAVAPSGALPRQAAPAIHMRPAPILPAAAAITLTTLSSAVDAGRARIEDSHHTLYTYDVEIEKKFAIAVACAIFVLLGAPIALRFPRGGVGLVIGVSFAVFGLYYVGLIAGEPLAQAGKVSPFWAMWASNVIFTIVGFILLARVGRAGSTARGGDLSELKDAIRAWVARLRHPGRTEALRPERAT